MSDRAARRRVSDKVRRAFLSASPTPGERATLDPEESHHVARVLRLRSGMSLEVFDGRGGAWAAKVDDLSRDAVTVLVGAKSAPAAVEPELRVLVCQAVVRPEKVEWVLQKGTELGVAAFHLFVTERTDAPPPSPSRLARYRRIVMEACKQSGRRVLPPVVVGPLETPRDGVAAIVLAPSCADSLGNVLSGQKAPEVWLAVGPEGGFSDRELDELSARGWRSAALGPRVLRTETAGAVAAAIVLHAWGDLGPVDSLRR